MAQVGNTGRQRQRLRVFNWRWGRAQIGIGYEGLLLVQTSLAGIVSDQITTSGGRHGCARAATVLSWPQVVIAFDIALIVPEFTPSEAIEE